MAPLGGASPASNHKTDNLTPPKPPDPAGSSIWNDPNRPSFAAVTVAIHQTAVPVSKFLFPPLKLASRQYSVKDGCPSVSFSQAELQEGKQRLQHSLIAKFSGGRPRIDEVRKAFAAEWALTEVVSIGAWDARHILIVLKSEDATKRVLAHPMRKVGQYYFRLFRWPENFHSRREPTTTATWVKLLSLPPQLYDQGIMKSIVNSFGKFIVVDEKTTMFLNPSFARVCIELDMAKAVPGKVWVALGGDNEFWL